MRRPPWNLLLRPPPDAAPDGALLADYLTRREPVAFERLVLRHAGTVWAVCRRVAGNAHDAEDAFQATFLVLVRSGRSIVRTGSLAEWLYGVAFRTAAKARTAAARRRRREAAAARPEQVNPAPDSSAGLATAVRTELAALPDRYRLPILLCDLEGLSRTAAATRLGWKEGTLSGRLNRGRKRLAERLAARGIAPAAALAVGATAGTAAATTGAVLGWVRTESSGPTPAVVALANGVRRDMTRKLLGRMTVGATVVLAGLGLGLFGPAADRQSAAAPLPKAAPAADIDVTEMRLQMLETRLVQRELKMTPVQRADLMDGLDELMDQLRAAYEAGGIGAPVGYRDYDDAQRSLLNQKRAFAATILTPRQYDRLLQVEVRLMQEFAPMDPRVAQAMELTDRQKERVLAVLGENEDFAGHTQAPDPTKVLKPHKWPKEMQELVRKELTAAQCKVWDKLMGEELSFDPTKNSSEFRLQNKYRTQLRPPDADLPGKGGR